MKTISSADQLPNHLAEFIWEICPWMNDGFEVGYKNPDDQFFRTSSKTENITSLDIF